MSKTFGGEEDMKTSFVKGVTVGAIVALVICAAIAYAIWPRPVEEKTDLELILEAGVIRVGTDAAYPPYGWIDEETGEIAGYEPEMVRIIADRLGVEIEWQIMEWAAVVGALKERKIDLICGGMGYRPDRDREMGLTRFHFDEYSAVIVHKDSDIVIKEFEDLAKYTVGVQAGTTQEKVIREVLIDTNLMDEDQLKLYPFFDLPIIDCADGKIDSVFIGEPVAVEYLKVYPLKIVFRKKLVAGKVLAVRKEAVDLLTEINIIIADLEFTSKLKELHVKYNMTLPEA